MQICTSLNGRPHLRPAPRFKFPVPGSLVRVIRLGLRPANDATLTGAAGKDGRHHHTAPRGEGGAGLAALRSCPVCPPPSGPRSTRSRARGDRRKLPRTGSDRGTCAGSGAAQRRTPTLPLCGALRLRAAPAGPLDRAAIETAPALLDSGLHSGEGSA